MPLQLLVFRTLFQKKDPLFENARKVIVKNEPKRVGTDRVRSLQSWNFPTLFPPRSHLRRARPRAFGRACAPRGRRPTASAASRRAGRKALGVVVLLALTAALWPPQLAVRGPDGDGGGGGVQTPYDALFRAGSRGSTTTRRTTMRTRWTTSARPRPRLRRLLRPRPRRLAARPSRCEAALGAAAAALSRPSSTSPSSRSTAATAGPVPHRQRLHRHPLDPALPRRPQRDAGLRASPPMEWIGMHSLEFYLLQFHVFLTRKSQPVLSSSPRRVGLHEHGLVGTIYVVVVVKASS